MQKLNIYDNNKDIIDKRQKIVAALYLVTDHLSDNEPLKCTIRTLALDLHTPHADHASLAHTLTNHLKSASIAKILSEHNTSILVRELTHVTQSVTDNVSLTAFFADTQVALSRTNTSSFNPQASTKFGTVSIQNIQKNEGKNKRQEDILSFINGRKSAVIKDISTLFPEVSEKTIQRELGTLVDTGKITKRGSKRWSIYMAI